MSGLQPPKGVVAKTAGFGGKVCVHMCVLQAYSTVFTGHRVVLQCNLLMAGVLHLVTTFISHSHTQLHTHRSLQWETYKQCCCVDEAVKSLVVGVFGFEGGDRSRKHDRAHAQVGRPQLCITSSSCLSGCGHVILCSLFLLLLFSKLLLPFKLT